MTPFLITLVLSLVACAGSFLMVYRGVARGEEADRRVRGVVRDHAEVGAYGLAYLAGGAARVAETAIAAAVGNGRLRVTRDGVLHLVAGAGPAEDAVEQAVIDFVEESGGQRRAGDVRWRVSRGPEVDEVRTRLVEMGLQISYADNAMLRGHIGRVRLRSTVTMIAALVFGVGFVVVSAVLPVGATLVLAGTTVVLVGISVWGRRRARRLQWGLSDQLTVAGRRRLSGAYPVSPEVTYGQLVGLYGPWKVEDPALAAALAGHSDDSGGVGFGGGDFGSGDDGGGGDGGDGGGGGCGGCGGCS